MIKRIMLSVVLPSFLLVEGIKAQDSLQIKEQSMDRIISALTADEKISLLVGDGDGEFSDSKDTTTTAIVGSTQKYVSGAAGSTHAISRLKIPAIVVSDGPAGVRIDSHREGTDSTFYCTHFPVATLLASTWNTQLIDSVGYTMGNEAHEYGIDLLLAPATNIMRNPLCGRNFEYYSEDPILSGKAAAAMIRGIQRNGVGASLKHLALNNQETNRTNNDAKVAPQVMHEIYLKPFEIAVKESQPWTVMTSYNRINGVYASENSLLLDTILRRQWGFKGTVMTDWLGGTNPVKQMQAGNDLLMPGLKKQQNAIKVGVEKGILTTNVLDRNVKSLLGLISKTPRFNKFAYSNSPDLKKHADISREVAKEGMVLLKNENNTLPLDTAEYSQAATFGITSYDFIAGGGGSGDVNRAYTISLIEGLNKANIQTDKALMDIYQNYITNESSKLPKAVFGTPVQRIPEMDIPDSIIQQQAVRQDFAIITLGRISGEFADRSVEDDFNLSATEQKLIDHVCSAFHAQDKKVVVILNTCGVIETSSWKEKPDAILVSWLAGQEGGNAVTDILIGKSNPSGKLTMTWPVAYEDVPSASNFPVKGSTSSIDSTCYEEGLFVGYRYYETFDKKVSYPFGYGLSYTRFDFDDLNITETGDTIKLTCSVVNSGDKAGKEVVQVYVASPRQEQVRPLKELKAFTKTRLLQPGESENISMSIPKSYLYQYEEESGKWILPEGVFHFFVNTSINTYRLEKSMAIKN